MLVLPSYKTVFKIVFKINLDYRIRNKITSAGSIVDSIKDLKEIVEFNKNPRINYMLQLKLSVMINSTKHYR